jgi:hypothetical protein
MIAGVQHGARLVVTVQPNGSMVKVEGRRT